MNPNNAKQNFISSLTKPKSNTPFDVFGSMQKSSPWNVPGTPTGYKAWKPTPPAPKPTSVTPTAPKTPYKLPTVTPQYPFGGGASPMNMNPASAVPNTGKQGFMDKLMGQFGGNKVANALETQPATSWIYGKQPSTTPATTTPTGIPFKNPFGAKVAEASDGANPFADTTSPTGGSGNFDQSNAFGTGATTPTTPPASPGDGYADFLRSYQKGMSNIDNQVIPLEDITGEQAHMRQLYGDELTARAALAKDGGGADEILSISEAKDLGVPYGTTKSQAISMGKTPGVGGGGGADIAKEGLTVIEELLKNSAGFERAVGIGDIIPTLPGSSGTDFKNNVNRLKALLTLDNLKLLKGAMSDKDLAFLLSVGTSLNTNMSKEAFANELTNIKTKLQGASLGGSTSGGSSGGTGGGQVGVGLF